MAKKTIEERVANLEALICVAKEKYREENFFRLPIQDKIISKDDAVEIALSLDEADISLCCYELGESGKIADDLHIILYSCYDDKTLVRTKLIEALSDMFDFLKTNEFYDEVKLEKNHYNKRKDAKVEDLKTAKLEILSAMLIRAYKEWEEDYSKLTYAQLEKTPLPAWDRHEKMKDK